MGWFMWTDLLILYTFKSDWKVLSPFPFLKLLNFNHVSLPCAFPHNLHNSHYDMHYLFIIHWIFDKYTLFVNKFSNAIKGCVFSHFSWNTLLFLHSRPILWLRCKCFPIATAWWQAMVDIHSQLWGHSKETWGLTSLSKRKLLSSNQWRPY